MKAMLLAAGRGQRLRPFTDRIPKCMTPLGGRPLLEHTIRWLARFGVTEIVINLWHLPEAIREHFGNGRPWGVRIEYSREEQLLGTAGGVKRVEAFFDGPFFVWYADNWSRCDLQRLYAFHQARHGIATLALHLRADPLHSGIVALNGQDRVVRFLEKPRPAEVFSRWVNAGIYVLEPEVFSFIPPRKPADFARDVFPALLAEGKRIHGYRLSPAEGLMWIDTPEDLRRAEQAWPNPPVEVPA